MVRRVQSCLDANGGHFQQVMMSSHFLHNEVRFKFCCNILISGKIIKEMLGSVASGTPCINVIMKVYWHSPVSEITSHIWPTSIKINYMKNSSPVLASVVKIYIS